MLRETHKLALNCKLVFVSLLALASATFAIFLFACLHPPDPNYIPLIPIVDGAAERAFRLRGMMKEKAASAAAAVHELVSGQELGGPNAVGRPGDLVLENDQVVIVIDRIGSSSGFAESGGNIVDAADAKVRKDEIGQVFTFFGVFPRQAIYEKLTHGTESDGAAWVEASGHDLYEPTLHAVTRYILRRGDRAFVMRTTLTNTSSQPIGQLGFGDAVQWGGAEKFAPDKGLGFKGPSSGAYVAGIGRFVSYAITSPEGAIDAISGSSWTDTLQKKDVTLAPAESATYERIFVIGERGDVASAVSELTHAAGGPLGAVDIQLVNGRGQRIQPSEGAKVVVSLPGRGAVMSIRAAQGSAFGGELPVGEYELQLAPSAGLAPAGKAARAVVSKEKVTAVTLTGEVGGTLNFRCEEARLNGANGAVRPCPCKATILGVAPTTNPNLGAAHVAGPAKNQVTTETGKAEVALAPGKYRVVLSRGPEFDTFEREITIAEAANENVSGTLRRVVDTSGYVATDFHQHTMLGADAPVAKRDRVIANAAEGVEVAVTSEHNLVADLQPIVRELGLAAYLVHLPGDEITTDSNRKPWGHANAFPLLVRSDLPRGGAPAVRDRTAREVFASLRASKTPFILQINHPRTGITGYFDQTNFDASNGEGTDPGYDPNFDALEVWNGRNVEGRDRVLDDFYALLRTSHPVTATADTDTHGIVGEEAGYPRTYVRVADDDHIDAWDEARSQNLVRGVRELRDVVLTNGPFLRVTANGRPIGGVASTKNGEVEFTIHVETAPWIDVNRLTLRRATDPKWSKTELVAMKPLASGAGGYDGKMRIRVNRDDAFVLIVDGEKPMEPVLSGSAAEITPWAMTGAIWIDADGDRRSLGRAPPL